MITFDGVSLEDSTYQTRFIKHESLPDRALAILKIARNDGVIIISDTYNQKIIEVRGILKGDSQTDLEQKIDTFTELISRTAKNLDIGYAGGTRRYIATAINPDDAFDRDHFHISYVPYVIHFLVPSGLGKDITETQNAYADITAWHYENTVTITGSYPAKPKIIIDFNTAGTCDSIQFTNTTTNTQITISKDTGDFSNGDILLIDCEKRKVTLNGADYDFDGIFPRFVVGTNNFQIDFFGASVTQDLEQASIKASSVIAADNDQIAQGFQPTTTGDCPKVELILKREDI
jgi:phage-related protein